MSLILLNPGGLVLMSGGSVLGSSAGLSNGASFTVTGSGFGTKSGSAPTVYDDMSSATMAAGPWDLIRPFYNSPSSSDAWTEQYRQPSDTTPNSDTWGATSGCIVPAATPFRTHYISSACMSVAQSGYAAAAPMFGKVFASQDPPFYLVCSWYEAVSPSWKFGSAYGYGGNGDNNFKWTNYGNSIHSAYTLTAGGNAAQYQYMEWGNSEFTGATATPTADINDDGPAGNPPASTFTGRLAPPNQSTEYHSANMPNKFYSGINGWVKKEFIAYFTASTNGFIRMAVSQPSGLNGGAAGGTTAGQARWADYFWSVANGNGQTDGYSGNPTTGHGRTFFLGGFRRNFPQAANRSYWSDIYLDMQTTGVGRIALTDASTLAASKVIEYQPYTSWSNTSVTCTCQKGNLSSGTVYGWYLDEVNGNQSLGAFTMN